MRCIERNLLYANQQTHAGKVFSIICLLTIEKEINTYIEKNVLGYTFNPYDNNFFIRTDNVSHKIKEVYIKEDKLIAVIEILDTKSGYFLDLHLNEYIFRPFARYFETPEHYFSLTDLYASAAVKKDTDEYNSFEVLWLETTNTEKKINRIII